MPGTFRIFESLATETYGNYAATSRVDMYINVLLVNQKVCACGWVQDTGALKEER